MALMDELSAKEQALLLGRQTFEDLRSYWPHQTDDPTGVAAHLDRVDKHVVTSTLRDLGWRNSRIVEGDPLDHVRDLRTRAGGEVVVTGSIQLCHALAAAALVDEYRLFTFPVWQAGDAACSPRATGTAGSGSWTTAPSAVG